MALARALLTTTLHNDPRLPPMVPLRFEIEAPLAKGVNCLFFALLSLRR